MTPPRKAERADETWETDPFEGYSPERFYTEAADRQGHRAWLRVPVPTHVAGRIAELIASREIPAYRTPQDLIRDALVHRLYYLTKVWPEAKQTNRLFQLVLAEAEREARRREYEAAESFIEQAVETARKAKELAGLERAREELESARQELDRLFPASWEPLREKFERLAREVLGS